MIGEANVRHEEDLSLELDKYRDLLLSPQLLRDKVHACKTQLFDGNFCLLVAGVVYRSKCTLTQLVAILELVLGDLSYVL